MLKQSQKTISKIFSCSKCGSQTKKWSGRCLECGGWGTIIEETKNENKKLNFEIINLAETSFLQTGRISTGLIEFDRVLGGGISQGSLILFSGEPGIGKSTLIAQVAHLLKNKNQTNTILYASGEESAPQVKERLERLGCDLKKISFMSETNVEKIISAAYKINPPLLIIDSIQTIYHPEVENEIGSINQIKAATAKFLELAKTHHIPIILIGHITKDGAIAGPKNLEHMVDVVLYFETDSTNHYRILRASKNRFGSSAEIGLFEMTALGFKEINNSSALFLETDQENLPGSAMSCTMEGLRPFLIEIQALTTKTFFGYPQRKSAGYDLNRLQIMISVLIKRAKINLSNQDVILNTVGGFKISETALDLAACFAIASSYYNQIIPRNVLILGEVGLNGEIRSVSKIENRLKEAKKLGFKKAILVKNDFKFEEMELIKIKSLNEIEEVLKKLN